MADDADRETTVITTDGGGGGGGTIVAVILLIAILGLLFYLFGDRLMGGSKDTKIDVDVSAPAKTG
jgi:uncharacterized membrane protein